MKAGPSQIAPQDAEGHLWDIIVIGTGAGGATAGFNLARLGRSVLFVERGKLLHYDPAVARGVAFSWTGDPETALSHGWWPRPIFYWEEEGLAPIPMRPPIGSGAGGSTALFNGVMDRFRPQDFSPRGFFPDAPGASLPDAWPVSYEEMAPFYDRAEALYRVRGTQDPLAPTGTTLLEPSPPSERELAIFDGLKGAGLHPYRVHSALERAPGCWDCPAMLCPRACRNDAGRTCLYPALEQYGARILPNCRAVRFEETGRVVKHVLCEWEQQRITLRARVFILAANAFLTPALLQRSANERFPKGLANSSGLVGRNLMLHAASHVFARLKRTSPGSGFTINHGVSLNDFYVADGTKLGNIHAHPTLTRDEMLRFLVQHSLRSSAAGSASSRSNSPRPISGRRWSGYLPRGLLSPMTSTAAWLCRSWMVFAAIIEDLPYPENFVAAKAGSDEDVVYTYRYPDELRRRAQVMGDRFKTAIEPLFDVRPLQPVGALGGTHVCGTCRFGDDPRTSVLDRDNRAHDLDNLYILDASFFPSSGGINPSLTVVANSLRATDKIARRV
ncbi:MAG TPA: GMC family oxidoreductase [Bradyrhizobium sp.]|nr:GMC family oxidoreductase [Bradyrhizobium sp.]